MKTKKRLIGILFAAAIALLPAFPPGAQAANVDSLEQVLRTGKLSNDERLQLYLDLYIEYKDSDGRKLRYYAQEGLALAQKEKNQPMQMEFFFNMGDACLLENKLDSTLYFFEQSLRLAQELGNMRQEHRIYVNMGYVYYLKVMYSQALQYYIKALSYFEKLDTEKYVTGNILTYIGSLHIQLQNYEQSLQYLSKAESLHRETGNKGSLASTIMAKAQVLQELREQDKATIEDEELVAMVKQALEIQQEINNRYGQLPIYATLCDFYIMLEDYANAQACIDSGLQLAEAADLQSTKHIQDFYNLQSTLYYMQGKYAESEELALKLLAISGAKRVTLLNDLMRNVIMSNIRMGKTDRAEDYLWEYSQKIKEYSEAEYEKSISEMEVKYETEKKELRITVLEKEREFYLWLGLAAAVILLLVLLAMFLWIKWVKKERQLVATQSVLDGEIAERTRLARDLHDGLGGMLSVVKLNLEEIKNGVPAEDVERYDYVLTPLNDSINELHRVTHNMMPDSLARSGLKMSLTDFCHSIPGVDFQYLGAADRLDPKLEVMIYRTVHELVNNALRHADAMHILVQIIRENSRLSLVVQDDGRGFDPKAITSGMGLKNIRHRVAANNGHLEISSEKGKGTEISMEFKI